MEMENNIYVNSLINSLNTCLFEPTCKILPCQTLLLHNLFLGVNPVTIRAENEARCLVFLSYAQSLMATPASVSPHVYQEMCNRIV